MNNWNWKLEVLTWGVFCVQALFAWSCLGYFLDIHKPYWVVLAAVWGYHNSFGIDVKSMAGED
jgi:hypothetical protein